MQSRSERNNLTSLLRTEDAIDDAGLTTRFGANFQVDIALRNRTTTLDSLLVGFVLRDTNRHIGMHSRIIINEFPTLAVNEPEAT